MATIDWTDASVRERLRHPETEADVLLMLEWFRHNRDFTMQRDPTTGTPFVSAENRCGPNR